MRSKKQNERHFLVINRLLLWINFKKSNRLCQRLEPEIPAKRAGSSTLLPSRSSWSPLQLRTFCYCLHELDHRLNAKFKHQSFIRLKYIFWVDYSVFFMFLSNYLIPRVKLFAFLKMQLELMTWSNETLNSFEFSQPLCAVWFTISVLKYIFNCSRSV